MACSPSDGNNSTRRVCVGDCFDVDSRGRLQLAFAPGMEHLFTCTDEGLCYSHQYPVRADTFTQQTGCGADETVTDFTQCDGDGRNFVGAGLKFDAQMAAFSRSNPEVNETTCAPTQDDSVNPTASTNELELENDSCTTWLVEIQTDQFYGFIDDFQPFKAGYARVLGEVRWGVNEEWISEWQRVYELARSGNEGVSVDASCTDCCSDLPETDGEDPPGNPRQECIDRVNQNQAEAEAIIRLLNFSDRLNTTGGAYRTFVELPPGDTLTVQTRARVSATCDQNPIIGARAGHITMSAMPLVGCTLDDADKPCSDCRCDNCA